MVRRVIVVIRAVLVEVVVAVVLVVVVVVGVVVVVVLMRYKYCNAPHTSAKVELFLPSNFILECIPNSISFYLALFSPVSSEDRLVRQWQLGQFSAVDVRG